MAGFTKSFQGLNSTKVWPFHLLAGLSLNWNIALFVTLLLDSNWNTSSSWVWSLTTFRLELNPQHSSVSSFPTHPALILGHAYLHNHVKQFVFSGESRHINMRTTLKNQHKFFGNVYLDIQIWVLFNLQSNIQIIEI